VEPITALVEQISPELVLVDPELARVARSQLSDPSVPAASPRPREARSELLAGLEATAHQAAEVRLSKGGLVEIEPPSAPAGPARVSGDPGKGERLRRAFETRLRGR